MSAELSATPASGLQQLSVEEANILAAELRSQLLQGLVPSSDTPAIERMVAGLGDTRGLMRLTFAESLGAVGAAAVPLLLRVVGGDNPAQAVAAVNALAQIDDPAIERTLRDLQNQPQLDSYVRETLESALARIRDLHARQPQPG